MCDTKLFQTSFHAGLAPHKEEPMTVCLCCRGKDLQTASSKCSINDMCPQSSPKCYWDLASSKYFCAGSRNKRYALVCRRLCSSLHIQSIPLCCLQEMGCLCFTLDSVSLLIVQNMNASDLSLVKAFVAIGNFQAWLFIHAAWSNTHRWLFWGQIHYQANTMFMLQTRDFSQAN